MNELERLRIVLEVQTEKVNASVAQVNKQIESIDKTVGKTTKKMGATFSKFGKILVGVFAAKEIDGFLKNLITINDEATRFQGVMSSAMQALSNAFTPVLEFLVTMLSRVIGFFAGLVSAISGVAASFGKATTAAKKLAKVYMGFDELNVIPEADSGAGATVGGPNAEDIENINNAIAAGVKFWEDWGKWLKIIAALLALIFVGKVIASIIAIGKAGLFVVSAFAASAPLLSGFAEVMESGFGGKILENILSNLQAFFIKIIDASTAILGKLFPALKVFDSAALAASLSVAAVIIFIVAFIAALVDLWNTNYEFRKNLVETWENIKDTFARIYNSFLKPIIDNLIFWFKMIWELALKPLWENFKIFVAGVVRLLTSIFNALKPIIDFLIGIFGPVFSFIFNAIVAVISSVVIVVVNLIGIFFRVFGVILDAVSDFVDAFGKAFAFIADVLKTPINFVIDAINFLIKALNKISFKAPDWLKYIGLGDIAGKTFGVNLSLIPKLADGGMLNAGQLFIAGEAGAEMVGTHKGRTTVMPLENTDFVAAMGTAVYGAVTKALSEVSNNGNTLVVDGMVLAKAVEKNLNKLSTLQGGLNIAL